MNHRHGSQHRSCRRSPSQLSSETELLAVHSNGAQSLLRLMASAQTARAPESFDLCWLILKSTCSAECRARRLAPSCIAVSTEIGGFIISDGDHRPASIQRWSKCRPVSGKDAAGNHCCTSSAWIANRPITCTLLLSSRFKVKTTGRIAVTTKLSSDCPTDLNLKRIKVEPLATTGPARSRITSSGRDPDQNARLPATNPTMLVSGRTGQSQRRCRNRIQRAWV